MAHPDRTAVWLLRAAMAAAVSFGASAEYHLADVVGAGNYVSASLPLAVDLYLLAALRTARHWDTAGALLVAAISQTLGHLTAAHQLAVDIRLTIAVSLLPVAALWRIHALQDRNDQMQPSKAHSSAFEDHIAPFPPEGNNLERSSRPVPLPWPTHLAASGHPILHPTAVPAARPSLGVHATWTPPTPASTGNASTNAPGPDELLPDARLIDQATIATIGRTASLRQLQRELQIGQQRAQRIRAALDSATHP